MFFKNPDFLQGLEKQDTCTVYQAALLFKIIYVLNNKLPNWKLRAQELCESGGGYLGSPA